MAILEAFSINKFTPATIVESRCGDLIALKGRGFVLKSGDHGAFIPVTSKLMINTKTQSTPNMAHGLFSGLRSPLLEINGIANNKNMVASGPTIIATDSILCGIKANNAKKGTIYQSGVNKTISANIQYGFLLLGLANELKETIQ